MRLSIYTYIFSKNDVYYLYNSQTGILTTITESLYEALYNSDFDLLDKETIDILKEKKIIVEQAHLYDYYHRLRLQHLSTIGDQEKLSLAIAPTTECNFACPYCFEGEKDNKRMTPEIVGELISFINKFQQSKELHITWYGGEPLIAFNVIKEIICRIKSECRVPIISQSIVTNGYLINDEIVSFMKENHFEDIQITFDGTRENHNKTRCLKGSRKPTFDTIMHNVEKQAKEMPNNVKISLRINVNRDNEEDYANMYMLIKEKFAQHKNIGTYPGFIRESNRKNNIICYRSLFGKSRYEFYKKVEKFNLKVDYYPKVDLKKTCMICHNNAFVIGPEGELYKCWNDFNNPDRIIGYLCDKKITNPTLVSLYAYDATIYGDPKCKECKLFPICDGGCGYLRYQNRYEGKKYNLCTFLSDNSILEECLLAKPIENGEKPIKAF